MEDASRPSPARARAPNFARELALDTSPTVPVIGVVGSKGKGSAVAATTQYLMSLGYRVGTISSPPFLTNRERIRLNARPLSPRDYDSLADRVAAALTAMPPVADTGGYLAPRAYSPSPAPRTSSIAASTSSS